jgi:hypothetical protein
MAHTRQRHVLQSQRTRGNHPSGIGAFTIACVEENTALPRSDPHAPCQLRRNFSPRVTKVDVYEGDAGVIQHAM